jgi:adenosylcobinamide-GDP ribazoletransferase
MDLGQISKGIKAGFGFLTTVPVESGEEDFGLLFNNVYIFIIVSALMGIILGIAGFVLQAFFPPALVPVLAVAAILLLTGINHLDGLSDMGDGIIASGTKEKKIAAMKDVHSGAGGILFIGMDLLFLFSAISLFAGYGGITLFMGLFIAEMCAKVSMLTVAAFGKSLHPGMGSMLVDGTRMGHYVLGVIIAFAASGLAMFLLPLLVNFPTFGPELDLVRCFQFTVAGFLAVAVSMVSGLLLVDIANKNFGGVNGDVLGAANEIGRIAAFLVLGMLVWMLW